MSLLFWEFCEYKFDCKGNLDGCCCRGCRWGCWVGRVTGFEERNVLFKIGLGGVRTRTGDTLRLWMLLFTFRGLLLIIVLMGVKDLTGVREEIGDGILELLVYLGTWVKEAVQPIEYY